MSKVDVTVRELESAFNGFSIHSDNAARTRYDCLDALYAIECGIACLILKERRQRDTSDFNKNINHDLNKYIDMLTTQNRPLYKLPSTLTLAPSRTLGPKEVSLGNLHSALRYGAKIQDSEWKKCAEVLEQLRKWIKLQISGR